MEDTMFHRLSTVLAAGWVLALAGPAAAQNSGPSGPASGGVIQSETPQQGGSVVTAEKKPGVNLSEQQKQMVIDAIVDRKSHQVTPKEFKAELGADVSSKVDLHAMPPKVVSDVAALKDFMYAHLDREIVIVDAMDKKVVALLPLPANLAHESGNKPEGAGPEGKPPATTGQSGAARTMGSGAPTADPLRAREESGKESAYTGPSSTGPNTDGK
jgi:hypothetical protein